MRVACLITLLLFSTSARAALVIPIGGVWIAGTTTAEFIAVPLQGQEQHRFQSVLTIDAGSHVISEFRVNEQPDVFEFPRVLLSAISEIDFYDGQGTVAGYFEFDLLTAGVLEFDTLFTRLKTSFDGEEWPTIVAGIEVAAGRHRFDWRLENTPLVNFTNATTTTIDTPEPSPAWLLAGLVFCAAAFATTQSISPRRGR